MLALAPVDGARQLKTVLCLGAHCDDIEIGCGGTILQLAEQYPDTQFYWVIFSSNPMRRKEAQKSSELFLANAKSKQVVVNEFRNGYFPHEGAAIKDYFEELKGEVSPDLIFTHQRNDLHQDHRLLAELTWNTFRDHLILEYEIMKYDGDLGSPNVFSPLLENLAERKVDYILNSYESQKSHQWFTRDTFEAMHRLRGVECNSPSGYAEAFYSRKAILMPGK